MLKIRKEQIDELAKVSVKRFEDDMLAHVKEFFPGHYEIFGEPTVRRVIQYAVDRSEGYGFTTERNVCLYINLILLLGSNFDADVQYPWAEEILSDTTGADPAARADRLHDTATGYLDRVAGRNNAYYRRALANIREMSVQDLSNSASEKVDRTAFSQLQKIWPEKCQEMGGATLQQLVQLSIEFSQGYDITSERGILIYAALMLVLGSGFDEDPQFPWAEEILHDESISDEATRVRRLYDEAMALLESCAAWSSENRG